MDESNDDDDKTDEDVKAQQEQLDKDRAKQIEPGTAAVYDIKESFYAVMDAQQKSGINLPGLRK
jgi:hypothetical protein